MKSTVWDTIEKQKYIKPALLTCSKNTAADYERNVDHLYYGHFWNQESDQYRIHQLFSNDKNLRQSKELYEIYLNEVMNYFESKNIFPFERYR